MNFKYAIVAFATVLIQQVSYGQQRFQSSLYQLNPYTINSAVAGLDTCTQINLQHKNQWTSVSGSPTATLLNGYTSIGKQLSLGFELSRWSAGVLNSTEFSAALAKGFQLNTLNLSVSAALGAAQHQFGLSNVTVFDVDNYLNQSAQNSWSVFADVSAYASLNNWEAGIALPRMLSTNSNFSLPSSELTFNPANYLRIHAAYKHTLNAQTTVKPILLYRSIPGNGGALDVLVHALYNDKVGLALGYRSQSGLLASLNYNINNNWQLGYGYDAGMQALSGISGGSHELLLTWRSCKAKQPKQPKVEAVPEVVLGTLNGTVSNNQNQPLADVLVELFSNDTLVESTKTDSLGNYTFSVYPTGNYQVKAQTETTQAFTSPILEFTENALNQSQAIQLVSLPIVYEVVVVNAASNSTIPNAKVELTLNGKNVGSSVTNANGSTQFSIPNLNLGQALAFTTKVSKEGFETNSSTISSTVESFKNTQLNVLNPQAFQLVEIPKEQNAVELLALQPIVYEVGSANLTAASLEELNKVIAFMNEHPTTRLEISAHTDCTGSAEGNLKLSKKRAATVQAYIQERISNPERIMAEGYGETMPLEKCACGDCTFEQNAANRRTEFLLKN